MQTDKHMTSYFGKIILMQLIFIFSITSFSAEDLQTGTVSRSKYVSALDESLFIKNVAVIKVEDNVQSVYEKSVTEFLKNYIDADSFWNLKDKVLDANLLKQVSELSADAFETNLEMNKKILKNCECEGFFIAKVVKSINQTSLKLTFINGSEGKPLIQETYQEKDLFETQKVNEKFKNLYENIKKRLPFTGYIISRKGDEVTINVGADREVSVGSQVSIVQVLNLKRHPKFYFMTESIKEVLGHLKIYKVEQHLSFAKLVYEKEPSLVGVGAKVIVEKAPVIPNALSEKSLDNRSEQEKKFNSIEQNDLAYGSNPKEWAPPQEPQFGKLYFAFRLGDYSQNSKLSTGETVEGKNGFVPGLKLGAEVWFTDKIIANIETTQTVFSVSNNLQNSSPGKISMSLNQLSVSGGYNFFIEDDFFGPKITLSAGYDMRSYRAASTDPVAITTMSYSGLFVSALGLFDVPIQNRLQLGAEVKLYLLPSLSESPRDSGSSSNSLTSFSFLSIYNWKPNYNIKGDLSFDYISTRFSGAGTRTNRADSTTHKETSLSVGLEYLF